MSRQPRRIVIVTLAVAAIVIVLVSLVALTFYYSSNAALAEKDAEILTLQTKLLTANATILQLQVKILGLDANLTSLYQVLAGLAVNQTVSTLQLASLNGQIAKLQNESALAQLELAVAEQVGKLSVNVYAVNETLTVQPGTTLQVTSQPNGYNGTLVFFGTSGCPSPGDSVPSTSPQFLMYILLDSRSPPLTSDFARLSGQPYSVYLQNVGNTAVSCTFSVLFVRQ